MARKLNGLLHEDVDEQRGDGQLAPVHCDLPSETLNENALICESWEQVRCARVVQLLSQES